VTSAVDAVSAEPLADPPASTPVDTSRPNDHGSDRWPSPSYWARCTVAVGAVILGAFAVYALRSLLVLVAISLILAVGLQRPLEFLERRGLRRGAALAVILVGGLAIFGGFLALVLPSVVRQGLALADKAPGYIEDLQRQPWMKRLDESFDVSSKLDDLGSSLPDQALTIGSGLLTAIIGILTVTVLTLFFAADLPRLRRGVARLLAPRQRERFESITDKVVLRVSGYVNGNLIVSVIAGVSSFVVLIALGVPYAAAVAFWVAITDCVPTIGAVIGAAAAMALAATVSWPAVLLAGLFFIVYQALENYLIAPRVMRGAIDMSMGAVLIAVLAGGEIMGLAGVVIALPVAAAAKTVLDELYLDERKASVERLERTRGRDAWRRRFSLKGQT
jgi:predicted PurR-regulated permease PerM